MAQSFLVKHVFLSILGRLMPPLPLLGYARAASQASTTATRPGVLTDTRAVGYAPGRRSCPHGTYAARTIRVRHRPAIRGGLPSSRIVSAWLLPATCPVYSWYVLNVGGVTVTPSCRSPVPPTSWKCQSIYVHAAIANKQLNARCKA